MKAQHEGALTPPGIIRRNPQVPHTARDKLAILKILLAGLGAA